MRILDPNIGSHPIPAVKVPDLLERIVADENVICAVKKVNAEPAKASGPDHRKVRDVCPPLLTGPKKREEIRKQLLCGKYNPAWIRLVSIPKGHGKHRTLGIANVIDRIVQRMILQVLDSSLPPEVWSSHSFAYRHGLGIANAIAEVDRIRQEGYKFSIALDLKAFFDNVPHDRLIGKLRWHITDKRVVWLITRFLTVMKVQQDNQLIRNRIGVPQGGVLSPYLASMLYLDELDKEFDARGLRFVRYADDVTVFCKSKAAAKRVLVRITRYLETRMHCPVNREKTHIVPIERTELLGVRLVKGHWHIPRETERQRCAGFHSLVSEFYRTKDDYCLSHAVMGMRGFLNHYRKIPDIAARKVPALKRWCRKIWNCNVARHSPCYRWFRL